MTMSTYATTARVRAEAGFEGNTNIGDDSIEAYLVQAHGIVQSFVAATYVLSNLSGALFTGSQAESMLQRAEELIAAGYLLIRQYGLEGKGTQSDGYAKKAEGEKLLQSLSDPKKPLILLDTAGNEFARAPVAVGGKIIAGGAVTGANRFSVNDVY